MAENFPPSRVELGALDKKRTALFLCDIQEKYKDVMHRFPEVVANTKKLVQGCIHMQVPYVVSEQSPAVLGRTVKEIETYEAVAVVSKFKFSMIVPEMEQHLETLCDGSLASVILCGMETHIEIEQTAIDLLSRGIQVHIVADCCTTRSIDDRNLALQRLSQIGCFICTCENVLFKLLESKEHPKFRVVAQLVKRVSQSNALSALF
ncbi:isochorismatase domain-containing protein 2 [Hyalella azteca]|uniref:Isochorismatase domain-containing protein 1 n=1 Tax=Hyalella azteca TaxID=294128 RepID=A0A8B7P5G2_HYAAZ|nr:isochorismatase domain-containing protein 2 [Hyalella azteca]